MKLRCGSQARDPFSTLKHVRHTRTFSTHRCDIFVVHVNNTYVLEVQYEAELPQVPTKILQLPELYQWRSSSRLILSAAPLGSPHYTITVIAGSTDPHMWQRSIVPCTELDELTCRTSDNERLSVATESFSCCSRSRSGDVPPFSHFCCIYIPNTTVFLHRKSDWTHHRPRQRGRPPNKPPRLAKRAQSRSS